MKTAAAHQKYSIIDGRRAMIASRRTVPKMQWLRRPLAKYSANSFIFRVATLSRRWRMVCTYALFLITRAIFPATIDDGLYYFA